MHEEIGDPTARALRLLSLLSTGRARSGAELAARLDVSPRTVRRDAERLRNLGYVVTARPGPGGATGWRRGRRCRRCCCPTTRR